MTELQQPFQPSPADRQTTAGKLLETRLLLICQAEGLHSRYSDLAVEDSGLTARGWEQTNTLSAWLTTHEKIDVLISAPQLRSRLTAQRLGQALNKSVSVHHGLPNRSRLAPVGVSGGTSITSSGIPGNGLAFSLLHVAEQFPNPGAHVEFIHQLHSELATLLQEYWGKTVAIVMDGNGIAATLRYFCGGGNFGLSIHHTSLSEIAWHGSEWSLLYVNRMEHAPASALPAEPPPDSAVASEAANVEEDLSLVRQVYGRVSAAEAMQGDTGREQRLRHLLKFAALPSGMRLIDVGTGNGRLAMLLAEEGASEVVGIDASPVLLEAAEYLRLRNPSPAMPRVSFRLAPAHRIPFKNEGFDAIVCRLLLHHSTKPEAILRELARLLKPGGLLILADLLSADDPVKRATQNTIEARRNPSHIAARSADQYRKLVIGAGLAIENELASTFDRDLEEWLTDLQSDPASRNAVREMIEAGLETNATGYNARRQGNKLVIDLRIFYLKASKK